MPRTKRFKPPAETAEERKARIKREYELVRDRETDARRVGVPYSHGSRILPLIDEDN